VGETSKCNKDRFKKRLGIKAESVSFGYLDRLRDAHVVGIPTYWNCHGYHKCHHMCGLPVYVNHPINFNQKFRDFRCRGYFHRLCSCHDLVLHCRGYLIYVKNKYNYVCISLFALHTHIYSLTYLLRVLLGYDTVIQASLEG